MSDAGPVKNIKTGMRACAAVQECKYDYVFAYSSSHLTSSHLSLHCSVDRQAALENTRPGSCRWENCGKVYPSKKLRSSFMPTAMQ